MVIMRGSDTFETPQSKFHTTNRINHKIPFQFIKKAQAMFSVKHLFSTSLDFCLCRNKISQFHKFHLKHSYIKIFNLINRSVFSARMKMVNTAIAIIASSKSLR